MPLYTSTGYESKERVFNTFLEGYIKSRIDESISLVKKSILNMYDEKDVTQSKLEMLYLNINEVPESRLKMDKILLSLKQESEDEKKEYLDFLVELKRIRSINGIEDIANRYRSEYCS